MNVVVIGATGNQGSAVVRHSRAAGLEVHALVRDLKSPQAIELSRMGVALRLGDLDQADSLLPAFEGMDAIFSVQNFWRTGHLREFLQGRAVVEAARAAGIQRFVQTTGGVDPGQGSANVEVKTIIEALVREAFPDAFILRPVWFLDGLNPTSFNKAAGTFEYVTAPDQPHTWVAIDDIGKMVAKAFSDFDSVAGLTMNFASRTNTANEMVATFNKALGTSFAYHQFSARELSAKIRSLVDAPVFVHELEAIFAFIRETNFTVDFDLHDRLLPDRHTLDSWSHEFALPNWKRELTS